MKEEKKYSSWEYEEEKPDQDDPDPNKDPNANPDDPSGDDPNKTVEEELSDDEVIKVKVDGKIVEMTRGELSAGYMRQSDYTRKTQELAEKLKTATPEQRKDVVNKAQEIVDNPDDFPAEDVKTAEYLISIFKKKFGLMTREDLEAEKAKEKQVTEFSQKLDTAKTEIGKMKGMPAWNEDEIIDFMQESGIHDPMAAYLRKYDAQYRDFIIKSAKGDTSYKSDKGGKKPEPTEKPIDVSTEEGHRSFISDELRKMKGE